MSILSEKIPALSDANVRIDQMRELLANATGTQYNVVTMYHNASDDQRARQAARWLFKYEGWIRLADQKTAPEDRTLLQLGLRACQGWLLESQAKKIRHYAFMAPMPEVSAEHGRSTSTDLMEGFLEISHAGTSAEQRALDLKMAQDILNGTVVDPTIRH